MDGSVSMGGRGMKAFFLACVLLSCRSSAPSPYENAQLGVRLVFPEAYVTARYQEKTPYGEMEWFGASCSLKGGLGPSYHVQVGNLPRGIAGGITERAVLDTFETWLKSRYQGVERTVLRPELGSGFRYASGVSSGARVFGVVIVARGRLHHAQAMGPRQEEERIGRFLDSFQVLKNG